MARARESRDGFGRDAGIRGARLEQLFTEELNYSFENEIASPELDGFRVSRVELSRDGARARVWVSLPPALAPELALRALLRAGGFLRYRLSEALPLKRTPELRFCPVPRTLAETRIEDAAHDD